MKKDDLHPKAIQIEVIKEQALQVTSAIRKIIKSKQFIIFYSLKVRFSPKYEHSQNTRTQTEIKQVILKQKQLVANVGIFESQGATWANVPFHPEALKKSLRGLALQIESCTQPGQKLFVALEKNRQGIYTLFYR